MKKKIVLNMKRTKKEKGVWQRQVNEEKNKGTWNRQVNEARKQTKGQLNRMRPPSASTDVLKQTQTYDQSYGMPYFTHGEEHYNDFADYRDDFTLSTNKGIGIVHPHQKLNHLYDENGIVRYEAYPEEPHGDVFPGYPSDANHVHHNNFDQYGQPIIMPHDGYEQEPHHGGMPNGYAGDINRGAYPQGIYEDMIESTNNGYDGFDQFMHHAEVAESIHDNHRQDAIDPGRYDQNNFVDPGIGGYNNNAEIQNRMPSTYDDNNHQVYAKHYPPFEDSYNTDRNGQNFNDGNHSNNFQIHHSTKKGRGPGVVNNGIGNNASGDVLDRDRFESMKKRSSFEIEDAKREAGNIVEELIKSNFLFACIAAPIIPCIVCYNQFKPLNEYDEELSDTKEEVSNMSLGIE